MPTLPAISPRFTVVALTAVAVAFAAFYYLHTGLLWVDYRGYACAARLYNQGLNPYTLTLAQACNDTIGNFVYPPPWLHLFAALQSVGTDIAPVPLDGLALAFVMANFVALPHTAVCLSRIVLPRPVWNGYTICAFLTFLGAAGASPLLAGNVALIAAWPICVAFLHGLRTHRWTLFHAAIIFAASIKINAVIFVLLPLICQPRPAMYVLQVGVTALLIAALYALAAAGNPELFRDFIDTLTNQVLQQTHVGWSMFGFAFRLINAFAPAPHTPWPLIVHGVATLALIALFFRAHKPLHRPAPTSHQYAVWILIVVLANPRLNIYDLCIAAIPLLAILMRYRPTTSLGSPRGIAIIAGIILLIEAAASLVLLAVVLVAVTVPTPEAQERESIGT